MILSFVAEEWSALEAKERTKRCRALAQEALQMAAEKPSFSQDYIEIAAEWTKLADDIDAESKRLADAADSR